MKLEENPYTTADCYSSLSSHPQTNVDWYPIDRPLADPFQTIQMHGGIIQGELESKVKIKDISVINIYTKK